MKNLGLILILVKLFGKVGPILLKLVKTAKFAKAGLAVGSLAAYSHMFTWQFALVLLFAIFSMFFYYQTIRKNQDIFSEIFSIPLKS